MSVLAWRKRAPASSFDPDEDDAQESPFYAGERICAPPANTRGNSALRACMVILIAAGGWVLFRNQDSWQGWLSTRMATASALMDDGGPSRVEPAGAPPDHADTAEPAPHTDTAPSEPPSEIATADDATAPQAPPLTTVATAPADKAPSVSPLPPPAYDQTNPYRSRAVAVGLHPNLSQVLLSRLSATDYSNARIAIETALAKTPDSGTFVWPRERRPELALFEVHFVPGAATGCRRYVVTVTKDRWSTTAAPMEKCGSGLASRSQ
jgi:hypothetical protein